MSDLPLYQPLLFALSSPLDFFQRPDTRIFWPFLLSSALFAVVFLGLQYAFSSTALSHKKNATKSTAFSSVAAYFRHTSLYLDVLVWWVNQCLRILVFIPLLVSQVGVALWVVRGLYAIFGDGPEWQIRFEVLSAFFALVSFVLDDFSRFYLHRYLHLNRWLWQFHQVHHSATALSPFTLYRIHPLEMVLYMLRSSLVLGLCAGVFSYCFYGQISGWHILGVNIFGFCFNAFLANLRHSPARIGFGCFEHIVISPAQHQIHHQNHTTSFRSNYGSCFSIWDRCFNSLRLSADVEVRPVGLNAIEHKNLWQVWFLPFSHCKRLWQQRQSRRV